ncbi:MAG: hypothetical protein HY758_02000 [Nitrospirae bacterium]|nr:hypothetical protein [Nitrospirota bacterium]
MIIATHRGRLILLYSLVTFLLLSGFFYGLYLIAVNNINVLTDDILLHTAQEKIAEFRNDPKKYSPGEVIEVMGKSYFKVIKTDTGILLKSISMPQQEPFLRDEFFQEVLRKGRIYKTAQTPAGNIRILFVPVDEKNMFQLSLPLTTQEDLLRKTGSFLTSALSVIFLLSSIAGWILADRAVRPVIKITRDAYNIAHKNIRERLDVENKPMEFSNLSLAFNTILDRIERFVESQKRFTTDISHEIRSPLTAIKGHIEVTLRRKRNTEEYEESLRNILEDVDRVILIANNLLFLTKTDIEAVELNLSEFNMARLLQRIIAQKKHVTEEKKITVNDNLHEVMFYGDEVLLSQLFSNLIDNAIHYTPVGGSIDLKNMKMDDGLKICVKDTGVGIPSNEIEKIFARFYRVRRNLSMNEAGSGLGLYISRWIAEAHGGNITAVSELDKGSEFCVHLPLIDHQPK